MSKYIIDTEAWSNLFEAKKVGIYGIGDDIVTDGKTVWSIMFSLNELEELNSDYINEHYGSLQDEAYQKGLEDAWGAARKIVTWPDRSLINSDTFDLDHGENIFVKYSASEAIAKLKAFEDKHSDRIEVGDEVKWHSNVIVITRVYENGGFNWCDGISQDGKAFHVLAENVHKTGKHYDIQSILEAMNNG